MPWCIWYYKTSWLLHDWKEMKKIIILIPVYNDWEIKKPLLRLMKILNILVI